MTFALDLLGLGAGAGLGAWGLRRLAHLAILRGLRAPRMPHERPIDSLALPGGRIESDFVTTRTGRRIATWLALPDRSRADRVPVVAVLHGWGANASTMWPVVPPLVAAGFAVLLVDARCHGESDDEAFTSMPRFAEDLATALASIRGHPGIDFGRVALIGHSVGAGAVLLHAARQNDPGPENPDAPQIRAVVSLSAFAHPREVMLRLLAQYRVPYAVLGWYVLRHIERRIGATFDAIAPIETIARVRCPVLLVHGLEDATVPYGDALRLRDACGNAEILPVSADHDLRNGFAPYACRLIRFLRSALEAPEAPASGAEPVSSKTITEQLP